MSGPRKARALGINHVVLEVGDLDEALEFYGAIFEFTLRGRQATEPIQKQKRVSGGFPRQRAITPPTTAEEAPRITKTTRKKRSSARTFK